MLLFQLLWLLALIDACSRAFQPPKGLRRRFLASPALRALIIPPPRRVTRPFLARSDAFGAGRLVLTWREEDAVGREIAVDGEVLRSCGDRVVRESEENVEVTSSEERSSVDVL